MAKNQWRPGVALPRPEGSSLPEEDVLSNPHAERIQKVASLGKRQARRKWKRFLAEGPQAVREAVTYAPKFIRDIYVTDDAASRYEDILAAARAASLYIHRITGQVMLAMSGDSQGILAVVNDAAVASEASHEAGGSALEGGVTEVLAHARLVAVLAEAQDPGNAGTIIRAADAAGADAVLLVRGSVDPMNPKVVRSTAGSIFHLPVISGLTMDEAVELLHEAGLTILAADGNADRSIFEASDLLGRRSAWLFGNEARGLGELTDRADHGLSIPIYGKAESLNVATAAAVCLYASAQQLAAE